MGLVALLVVSEAIEVKWTQYSERATLPRSSKWCVWQSVFIFLFAHLATFAIAFR
jgi:hypothetical protein